MIFSEKENVLQDRLPSLKQWRMSARARHRTSGGTRQVARREWPSFVNCSALHKRELLLCCSNDRYELSSIFLPWEAAVYWRTSTLEWPLLPSTLNHSSQRLCSLRAKPKFYNATEQMDGSLSVFLMKP